MVLIFFGTIDQVEYGIWHTQKLYFESFIVVWNYSENLPFADKFGWLRLVMPGGYTIGSLLLINLVAAHISRFKLTWKKSGIFLVHFGLILLLVSELLTDLLSVESQMPIDEGGRSNYSFSYRDNELVFIDRSPEDHDIVHSIPTSLLKPGREVAVPNTPLSIRTVQYFPNSEIGRPRAGPSPSTPATQGAGVKMGIFATPRAVSYADDVINTASAYVEVIGPDGSLGVWLLSNVIDDRFPPQLVSLGEQTWEVAIRLKRHYYPFQIELLDFTHEKYPGTEIPFNYSSEVIARHNDSSKTQKALIYMNHPLRFEGLTFYQSSFANQDTTSIFLVVRNPGWVLPYLSVLLMGLGMCVQFGMHFFKFLNKTKPA
ncbi:MAG: cytochrome c biogenesis protein ResB [Verrucomicrobiota bacterium]